MAAVEAGRPGGHDASPSPAPREAQEPAASSEVTLWADMGEEKGPFSRFVFVNFESILINGSKKNTSINK